MGLIKEIQEKLLIATQFRQYQNCWISDIAWLDILKHNLGYDVTKGNLIKAFNSLTFITHGWNIDSNERNFKLKDFPRLVRFYYVNTGTTANKNYSSQQWQDIYKFHRLTRLIMNAKEKEKDTNSVSKTCEHIDKRFSRSVPVANRNKEETSSEGVASSNSIHHNCNSHIIHCSYFDSAEAKNLFRPFPNETVLDCISRRINILSCIIEKEGGINKYVNYSKDNPLTNQQVQNLTHQCLIIRACYYNVLRDMPTVQNWSEIIKKTLKSMSECGIKQIKNEKTVRRWHSWFKKYNSFPHPNHYVQMQKKVIPKIFEVYPEAEKLVDEFASKNLETLSSESMALHIKSDILPWLHNKHTQEQLQNNMLPLSMDDFCYTLNLSTISPSTAWRWLKGLGYKHGDNQKCYYNDKHEDEENVKYRVAYIVLYLRHEVRAYNWVQILEEEGVTLENNEDIQLVKAYHSYTKDDGTKMREYHIDTHPELMQYVCNKKMRGDLSVRKLVTDRPLIIIGQDECVIKQYSFSSKTWFGKNGEKKLLPKSDGYSLMISAFCSRCFGLGLYVSEEQLSDINEIRSTGSTASYISEEAAMEIYGTKQKKLFEDRLTLIQSIWVGINADGYWNNKYMALQMEDAADVLGVVYPECDIMFLMDQSSGHGKAAKGAIEVGKVNKLWGGTTDAVSQMRDTIVREVGVYNYNDDQNPQLQVNDVQKLTFQEIDTGPFYVKEPQRTETKYPVPSTNKKKKKFNTSELLELLKDKINFVPKRRYLKEQIQKMATDNDIPIEVEIDDIEPGWVNNAKGLLHILYERQMIDKDNVAQYSKSGLKKQKGNDGNVLPQYKKYLLTDMLNECSDIKEQLSSMEELMDGLSSRQEQKFKILTSPKYHCEIAGEGIELCWGFMKKSYRSIPMEKKNTKESFLKCVRKCIESVKVNHVSKFAAKNRRYMLAYRNIEHDQLSYGTIEKFVKTIKTHRNMADSCKGYIEGVWRETFKSFWVEHLMQQQN